MSDNVLDSLGIQLKGTSYGLRVVFPVDIAEEPLLEQFEAIPVRMYAIPIGTGLVLDFQSRLCSEDLISKVLFRVVWPKGLNILSWFSSNDDTLKRFRSAGFQTSYPHLEANLCALQSHEVENVIIDHSMRSGQREEYLGNVVLTGHLNSGAEIFAGGSISVLGKLKGLVHAGRKNAEGVYVIAGSFEPQQVRIADKLCAGLGENMEWWRKPVIITLEEGKLIVRELKLRIDYDITTILRK